MTTDLGSPGFWSSQCNKTQQDSKFCLICFHEWCKRWFGDSDLVIFLPLDHQEYGELGGRGEEGHMAPQ